jgi:hypothetical protein
MSLQSRWLDILAFGLTAFAALWFDWQANELCWGLWISSLLTGWAVIVSSVLRVLLHMGGLVRLRAEDSGDGKGPLRRLLEAATKGRGTRMDGPASFPWAALLMGAGVLAVGVFTWFHFTFFHTVHAMLMSFFLQMEPKSLFGPNGFINADKGTVLLYLGTNYWAMILSTFIARRGNILSGNPEANLGAIYRSVVRIHVFILLSGFLFFLIYFGLGIYKKVLLLILLFLFFFPFHAFRRRHSKFEEGPSMSPGA